MNTRINSYVEVELWANVTGATTNYSERAFVSLAVGALGPTSISLGTCPAGCGGSPFPANSLLFLAVMQHITFGGGGGIPASGMRVTLSFVAGTTPVSSVPGNPPLVQMTNATGAVGALFLADPTIFSTHLVNTIVVNVTDPVDAATTQSTNVSFDVPLRDPGKRVHRPFRRPAAVLLRRHRQGELVDRRHEQLGGPRLGRRLLDRLQLDDVRAARLGHHQLHLELGELHLRDPALLPGGPRVHRLRA